MRKSPCHLVMHAIRTLGVTRVALAWAHLQVFGALQLMLSQLPDISSLREINLVCTFCTICFAAGCLALSVCNGQRPPC